MSRRPAVTWGSVSRRRLASRWRRFLQRPGWLGGKQSLPRPIQRTFAFLERSQRLARRFKAAILLATAAIIAVTLAASPTGRYAAGWTATRVRWSAIQALGLPLDRSEIEADWQRRRLHDIEQTRGKLRSIYAEYDPPMRSLLDYAGLDPDHALLRWGNFDKTLYLPSTVFLPDDTGRSYRFRPHTRSIWIRNLKLKGGILAYFPVPLGSQLDALVQGTGALVVSSSVQTTSSWGLRGPEPDLQAPLRGIILGDSYMQGLFVGDDQTPCECLKRELSQALKTRVEILNTGHLGYSPEQEYHTLREYCERFRPRFVVLSLFANDFGDLFEVLEGKGDWDEGRYWLGQITQYCRTKEILCLAVPAPWINQLQGDRRAGFYPGKVSNILESTGQAYLDPFEAFATELLRLTDERQRQGKPIAPNPLFNGVLGDGHFSPAGCELWARTVATRLELLLGELPAQTSTRNRVGRIGSSAQDGETQDPVQFHAQNDRIQVSQE